MYERELRRTREVREGKGMRDETKQESRRKEECVFIVEEKK